MLGTSSPDNVESLLVVVLLLCRDFTLSVLTNVLVESIISSLIRNKSTHINIYIVYVHQCFLREQYNEVSSAPLLLRPLQE